MEQWRWSSEDGTVEMEQWRLISGDGDDTVKNGAGSEGVAMIVYKGSAAPNLVFWYLPGL